MIYSVVTMMVKEGKMDEFIKECIKLRPLVISEKGCLMYDYTREIQVKSDRHEEYNENRITLYEKWSSQEALDLHNKMPYMKEFSETVSNMRDKVIIRTGVEAFSYKL